MSTKVAIKSGDLDLPGNEEKKRLYLEHGYQKGGLIYVDVDAYNDIRRRFDPDAIPYKEREKAVGMRAVPLYGPGTELKNLLRKFGIVAKAGCSCNSYAQQMNIWGPEKCEEQLPAILVWLERESARRKLPFLKMAAELLVRRAIKTARRKQAQAGD